MKIICIGQNYTEHIKELNGKQQEDPVIFLKPDTSILLKNQPFFIPDFSDEVHHEIELIIKINKVGKYIEEKFAHKYFDQISVGIDFTARDIQKKMKANGLPWEVSKAFDGSAVIGKWISKSEIDLKNVDFSLTVNDEVVQSGNTSLMIHSVDKIISYVSQFFTLKIGDIIFTGTPAGVAKVNENDKLKGFIQTQQLLDIKVK